MRTRHHHHHTTTTPPPWLPRQSPSRNRNIKLCRPLLFLDQLLGHLHDYDALLPSRWPFPPPPSPPSPPYTPPGPSPCPNPLRNRTQKSRRASHKLSPLFHCTQQHHSSCTGSPWWRR